MTDTINGRTPEEIKLRLACIFAQDSGWCEGLESCEECEYNLSCFYTEEEAARDSLILIQQLERERDAAVEQLKEVDKEDLFRCSHCIHDELCNDGLTSCVDCDKECPCHTCRNSSNWQWRGVQEVE